MLQNLESKPLLQGSLRRVYIGVHVVFRHPSNNSIRSNQQGAEAAPVLRTHANIVDYFPPITSSLSAALSSKSTSNPRPPSSLGPSLEPSCSSKSGALHPNERVCVRLAVAEVVPLRQAPD